MWTFSGGGKSKKDSVDSVLRSVEVCAENHFSHEHVVRKHRSFEIAKLFNSVNSVRAATTKSLIDTLSNITLRESSRKSSLSLSDKSEQAKKLRIKGICYPNALFIFYFNVRKVF